MPWRVLVTGANGFVGSRLVARIRRNHPDWTIDAAAGPEARRSRSLDVTNSAAVIARVAGFSPDLIIHLAALASVPVAAKSPRRAFDINLGGTLNVTEAIRLAGGSARLFFVSSAEVYGLSLLEPGLHDETDLLRPTNAYAASKAAADILVRQAAISGLPAIVVRPFNHIGAGQSRDFVVPSFCSQIASIEVGSSPPIMRVGNLEDERDFLHVEDVIDAYLSIIDVFDDHCGGVFNVASGRGVKINNILGQLIGMSAALINIEVDPSRLRPEGVTRIIGDAKALNTATGWSPRRTVSSALEEVLAAERKIMQGGLKRD